MLKSIVFADEITVWWTKCEFAEKADGYKLYLDGVYTGGTDKTHYSFLGLQAERTYGIAVEAYVSGRLIERKEYVFTTKRARKRVDVTKPPYNAVPDGKTLNTLALQKAFDDCDESSYLYFPKGEYLTGALDVHSGCEVYLDEGAEIRGSQKREDYLPKIKSRFEGTEMECYRSLLNLGTLDCNNYGYSCENVAFRGKGAILGGGYALAMDILQFEREQLKGFMEANADYVKTCETVDTIPGRARGRLINMSNCRNVVTSGLTMGYGASWNIHFVYCKDIVTYGCTVCSNVVKNENGEVVAPKVWNGDGWDPDSSEDCVVFNTDFKTGDDCIAIKSGKNPEGNVINRPTRNVYVFDCRMLEGHSVSIGSEMSGGVENVYVWDSDLSGCYFGIQVKGTKKRGSYVRNLRVSDSILHAVYVRSVGYNDDGVGSGNPPVFSDYYFENVVLTGFDDTGTGKGAKDYVVLYGFDEEGYHLRNVFFNNVRCVDVGENIVFKMKYADNVEWKNVKYIKEQ